ncbi:MAG: ATP-binding protein [Pseudomonadota bacterium]
MTNDTDEAPQSSLDPVFPLLGFVLGTTGFALLLVRFPELIWLLTTVFLVFSLVCWRLLTASGPKKLARRDSRALLQGDHELANAMVEAMQHPVLIIDERAKLLFANSASIRVFGKINKDERIFIRFRQPDLKRMIEHALSSGLPGMIEYNEAIPGDRWFAVEISPVRRAPQNGARWSQRFIVSFQNLTEIKRIDQMRSDFIANASHELRTPLASLLGYLETMKGPARADAKARARFLDIMLEQAERMSRLVNDLLSLSRIEMKSHLRPADRVNLSEVMGTVINALQPLAEQLEVSIEFNPDKPYFVKGDRDELVQVFENIVENACKYGQDGGKVEVALVPDNDDEPTHVSVSVRDHGPGIAIEHQHRITERFYRVDVARSREKQGTGLGLAIVKHILQRHGTRLRISSNPGEGAEFRVVLEIDKSVIE